ncbi:catalase [Colletotrichum chrysophilum]|uniref:Catalase n=1 Tax=Colletotrichum chrysophilum TaxID=1836956 RepID=A0AAD9ARZ1_9PEZI|nr:catalase [Colletotrichum chrysophilum]
MAAETVAKLVIPRQNIFYFERKPFWEVYMRADPWHGLKSLQPLGSPNRLMRVVYAARSKLRRDLNSQESERLERR